jgi:hypothetical protein
MKHPAATAIGILLAFATCTARADTVTDWSHGLQERLVAERLW